MILCLNFVYIVSILRIPNANLIKYEGGFETFVNDVLRNILTKEVFLASTSNNLHSQTASGTNDLLNTSKLHLGTSC